MGGRGYIRGMGGLNEGCRFGVLCDLVDEWHIGCVVEVMQGRRALAGEINLEM